jgi:hypothetical protein
MSALSVVAPAPRPMFSSAPLGVLPGKANR